jgi:transcriptional regulator with XRE-family HTH domain
MTEPHDWQSRLREARRELGLSQHALARLTRLSAETIRAYEARRRRPTKAHLESLVDVLGLPPREANRILSDAGYSPREKVFPVERFTSYYFSEDELQAYVDRQPWPEFVLNQLTELVAANAAAQALWGVDLVHELASRSRAQLNMLAVASQHRFADLILNWEDAVRVLVAVSKGQPRSAESLEDPSAYFSEVLAEFAKGDPAFLPRLATIWERTPAREAKCHWSYPIVWCDPEFGEMRFSGVVSTASETDGFGFNSWIPLDARTWEALERVKQRHDCAGERRRAPDGI